MGKHPTLGKRQKKWLNDAIVAVGPNPSKVYQRLIDIHPRLAPTRLQTIRYVREISNNSCVCSQGDLESKTGGLEYKNYKGIIIIPYSQL